MKLLGQLQELLQVDDLVISPVADIAPGVVGLLDFPVDTLLGDAIRIVSIHRRCVDELGDHVLDEFRIAEGQRFPVLKDVAPVAFVGEQPVAELVLELDGKAVPGAARVAVAAAECNGKVFVAEPLQLRIAVRPDLRDQLIEVERIREAAEQGLTARVNAPVEMPHGLREVARRYVVLIVENAAAQDIEQHVRIMMAADGFLCRYLEAVACGHDAREFVVAHIDGTGDGALDIGFAQQPVSKRHDLGLRLLHVGHELPMLRLARR